MMIQDGQKECLLQAAVSVNLAVKPVKKRMKSVERAVTG